MNEKLIERKLREAVKNRGGLALKFVSPGFTGVPDRIILMPSGKICFAEIKTTGEKPSPRQKIVIEKLKDLGFIAEVIDSQEALTEFLNGRI